MFYGHLHRAITSVKRKLWFGRRDDLEVRIELSIEPGAPDRTHLRRSRHAHSEAKQHSQQPSADFNTHFT